MSSKQKRNIEGTQHHEGFQKQRWDKNTSHTGVPVQALTQNAWWQTPRARVPGCDGRKGDPEKPSLGDTPLWSLYSALLPRYLRRKHCVNTGALAP